MSPVNAKMESKPFCFFKYSQDHIELINLPSDKWNYSRGNELFFDFQRVEDNFTIGKRVAIVPPLKIKMFINDKLITFCKYIEVTCIEEFENLLREVDEYP